MKAEGKHWRIGSEHSLGVEDTGSKPVFRKPMNHLLHPLNKTVEFGRQKAEQMWYNSPGATKQR